MNYPVWQLDVFGGGLWVILIAVFHVYIAHFAVGGGLFLVLAERKGLRENNPAMLDYVRRHARFFLLVTMVLGSMTGVGIWFIISLLNPAATSVLIHTFVFAWAAEWVFFLLEIVALFLYAYTFGRMAAGPHQLLGWIYFGAAWMSLFIINGVIDFMLTPGTWPQDNNFWSGFFNPTFWPALFFRTFFALIIAGLFGLMTAAWIREERLRTRMVVFFIASAWWYKAALPAEVQEMIFQRMPEMRAILDGFLLGAPVLLFGGLLLVLRLPAALAKTLAVLLLLIGQLYMGLFEFIREGGRRPYIIRDVMYSTSIRPEDEQRLQQAGVLRSARWVRHREITDENRSEAGRELYNLLCLSCHAIGGPMRDIRPLTATFTSEGLDALLSGMDLFYPAMPAFAGTPEERAVLADYIAHDLNGRVEPGEPMTLTEKMAEVPVFDPKTDRFVLLAWSERGLQLVDDPGSPLALFPGGVSLRAQLIRRGETPAVVTTGVTLTYRVEDDGATSGPQPLTGAFTPADDSFVAERLALSPYPRRGGFDPYPVVTVEARDERDQVIAQTRVAVAVSTETGCRNCHGGDWRVDGRAGLAEETANNILAVHDRLSDTDLQARAARGPVRCRDCHAGAEAAGDPARLNLSAAMHGFHANYLRGRGAEACALCHPSAADGATRGQRDIHASVGLDCGSCHGTVEDHAVGLLKQEQEDGKERAGVLMAHLWPQSVESIEQVQPRRPWVNQPDCLHCHADFQPPETDATFNLWTAGADDLFRARTDDSGRLFCAACHASAHALHPAVNPYGSHLDALQPLQYQTNRLPLGANRNCALCHTVAMEDEMHHPNMLRDFRNE
jgi:hypothetical protein